MKKLLINISWIVVIIVLTSNFSSAQGFLHRNGKKIVDGGENIFLIRSIGTGNWMLQEGYMMQTAGVAGTQHEFRNKLLETIGQEKTDSFYAAWLSNHFTKTDVDSMKSWGFNTVRPALHYKWFTLPIEEEPNTETNTWLDKGFEMVDSLLSWCAANEMYVILDMHGCPGGQGTNADISDYDPTKPSLWESQQNKDKLIVLWRKLAERYANESWVGGYDLINETNWNFSEPNNQPLWDLFKDITTAIREVDTNHLIFLEGNWFANDYTGLPAIWDDNMALSFHKYWTYNDENSLNWMIALRDQHNIPLWLGESGENSNTWFTNLIALSEEKNIGWSWWPVKKVGINNVMQVELNSDYDQMVKSWRGEAASLSANEAYAAVMTFAENHKIENCIIQYDVIDAMIRQPFTKETQPFTNHVIESKSYFSDYDLGRNNYAYYDTDTANYHGNTGQFTNWNKGWSYRNDGIDIEPCTDNYASNGYSVGWTEKGEWMQYTIKTETETETAYSLEIRSASGSNGSILHFEINNVNISPNIKLPTTGGWQTWNSTIIEDVILPAGENNVKVFIDKPGSNLNYFLLKDAKPVEESDFEFLSAKTVNSKKILLTVNKGISTFISDEALNDFSISADGSEYTISKIELNETSNRLIEINTYKDLFYNQTIVVSYTGSSIESGEQSLHSFTNQTVLNNLEKHFDIPGKIEAENFNTNHGFEIEDCEDFGEGSNLGYADAGDYVEYLVYVQNPGWYKLDYRLASEQSSGQIITYLGTVNNLIPTDTLDVNNTGGWQVWKTQSTEVKLSEGIQTLKLFVKQGSFNLNWFKFSYISSANSNKFDSGFNIYPNPAKNFTILDFGNTISRNRSIDIFDSNGRVILSDNTNESQYILNIANYTKGYYFILVMDDSKYAVKKLIIF